MMRLIALAALAWVMTASAQAMPMAPVHGPDGVITQVAYGCGPGRTRIQVSAWPGPPFAMLAAIIAGAHDGMEALACATTTTESPFFLFNSISVV